MKAVVIGGTGTLGKTLTRALLDSPANEVVCVSRCELKQKEMASEFGHDPRLTFFLGDVRDRESLRLPMVGAEVVFHVAALKHVDWCEANPEESIKTNILGTMNVAQAAIGAGVSRVVFSSTDKAVDPINVYGMCKGISEKLLLRLNALQSTTVFSVYRWGNVLGSRGSVIKQFAESMKRDGVVQLTNPSMSRFWITIEDAVQYMLSSFGFDEGKEVRLPPIKAASVLALVEAIGEVVGVPSYGIKLVGLRPGEKIHEVLRSQHSEDPLESLSAEQYTHEELVALVRPVLEDAG